MFSRQAGKVSEQLASQQDKLVHIDITKYSELSDAGMPAKQQASRRAGETRVLSQGSESYSQTSSMGTAEELAAAKAPGGHGLAR